MARALPVALLCIVASLLSRGPSWVRVRTEPQRAT